MNRIIFSYKMAKILKAKYGGKFSSAFKFSWNEYRRNVPIEYDPRKLK